jgi:flagellar basal-body rod modification protein FlgD
MGSVAGSSAAAIWAQADAASSANSNSSNTTGTNSLSNTSAFLQLLVAQLKNQDPTQPMDPTTFVTQLAEFNDVQQNLGTRQDMDALTEKYLGVTTPPSGGTGDSSTNATGSSDSNSNQTNGTSGSGS